MQTQAQAITINDEAHTISLFNPVLQHPMYSTCDDSFFFIHGGHTAEGTHPHRKTLSTKANNDQ
jgi:hypothetical protein